MTRQVFVVKLGRENRVAGQIVLEDPVPGSTTGTSTDSVERFAPKITSLRKARLAVQEELEPLQEVHASEGARAALLHLHRSVGRLVVQAEALLAQMNDHGTSDSLIEAAVALSDYFWDTRKRIATML